MPIDLFLRSKNPSISTLEGLEIAAGLRNRTGAGLDGIPRPELDATVTFTIDVNNNDGGATIRRMNAITQQLMLTMGRPSPQPEFGSLGDGESWVWNVDCATLHYTLPPGRFRLIGRYEPPGRDALSAASPPLAIVVSPEQVVSVAAIRDNPVLPGFALLIGARATSGGPIRYFLRQHSGVVPLAAWYSKPVLSESGIEGAIIAAPDYVRREDFEPAFRKWLVWLRDGRLHACCFRFGIPLGAPWTAPAPKNARLHSAFSSADGSLNIILAGSDGRVFVVHWNESGLKPLFSRNLPSSITLAIASDEQHFYVAFAAEGIVVRQISRTGEIVDERRLFERAGAVLRSIEWDWPARRVRAIFERKLDDRIAYTFVVAPLSGQGTTHLTRYIDLPDQLSELAFDCAENGRFHILATTATLIYYLSNDGTPAQAAEGAAPFFPQVVCGEGAYLGWAVPGIGYRTWRVNSKDPVNFLIDYDEPAGE